MRKPNQHDFIEERKIDGVLYKSVNEEMYRDALKKWKVAIRHEQERNRTIIED